MKFLTSGLVAALAISTALAGGGSTISTTGSSVVVNGSTILTFKTSSRGVSPEKLAAGVASRLSQSSGTVSVRPAGDDYIIRVGGSPVITVTRGEALARSVSRKVLAFTWAEELRRALKGAKSASESLTMCVGDVMPVPLNGEQGVKVTSSDERFLSIRRTETGFAAEALRPGTGFITINKGGSVRQLNFVNRVSAGRLPDQFEAQVTGRPAIPGTVRGAIEAALKRQTVFAPLAKLEYSVENVPSLGLGMTVNVPVRVNITAPGTVPRTGTVTVKVVNVGLIPQDESVLWYCNDPERVKEPGNLFAANLEAGKSARYLYHHINDSSTPLILRTLIVNDTDQEAVVALTPGDSAPDKDPVGAGMRAGDIFFRAVRTSSAEMLTIPARSSCPLTFRRLGPQDVISGLATIRLVSGPDRLMVRADAFPPLEVAPKWKPALTSPTPWREVGAQSLRDWDRTPFTLSDHIYPDPIRNEEWEYKVGGRMGVFRLGQKSIQRQDQAGRLDGNFGVTVNLDTTLTNPLDEPVEVEIAFETSAGYSGGLFFIDDRYVMTPKMLPKAQARIALYKLGPGVTKRFKISTLPLSGSSYPATLFARVVSDESPKVAVDLSNKR